MKRLMIALALALALGRGVARADGPGWTPAQAETIRLWYVASEREHLSRSDVVLGFRVLRRETQYGLSTRGDCDARGYCRSIGAPQFHEGGVYLATPQYKRFGLAGRADPATALAAMAWAFAHGYKEHWQTNLHDAHWWDATPPDPRPY
jgi:hypothetical protein